MKTSYARVYFAPIVFITLVGCDQKSTESETSTTAPAVVIVRAPEHGPLAIHGDSKHDKIARGRFLLEELGCIHCHASASPALSPRGASDLSTANRLSPRWIHAWLESPERLGARSHIPSFALDASERRDLAMYLGRESLGATQGQSSSDDVEVTAGKDLYHSIGCIACHGEEGMKLQSMGSKMKAAVLAEYLMDPQAIHQNGRMPSFLLERQEARQLAAYLSSSRDPLFETPIADAAGVDLERARELLETRGCLLCHQDTGDSGLESRLVAPSLERLSLTRGCLSKNPLPGLPNYRLAKDDLEALIFYIEFSQANPEQSPSLLERTRRQIEDLHCTACHRMDHSQPSAALLERAPPLTGVGAKLKSDWMARVLLEKKRVRPYLTLRMPHYSAEQVRPLIAGLAALSGLDGARDSPDPLDSMDPETLEAYRETGVHMLGGDVKKGGLSCVACHDFREHRALADEHGPLLESTFERLRFDWFQRWMHDPARLVPGTSMPVFFAHESRERADERILELWSALALGEDMPELTALEAALAAPVDEVFPAAGDDAVIIRFPLAGTTAAAISVGLPRQGNLPALSYCFDATYCQLVLAWSGGFLDLSGSMSKRLEYPRVIGDVFYRTQAFPLRLRNGKEVPGHRFRGYRIVKGIPEFLYEIDADGIPCKVRERVEQVPDTGDLLWKFWIDPVPAPMWFVVEPDQELTFASSRGALADGGIELPRGKPLHFSVTIHRVMEEKKQ